MGLLNRGPEHAHLYDREGRLQGGLSALEELAQVIALGNGAAEGGDGDAVMDSGEDELEPAHEFPVSDPAAHAADIDEDDEDDEEEDDEDEDEEMSSDAEGSSDDAMDDVALDAPPPPLTSPVASLVLSPRALQSPGPLPTTPESLDSPSVATPPPPSPSESLDSSGSRLRLTQSRRSLRRSSRQDSLQVAATLPPGERLKQKFIDAGVLSVMLVCYCVPSLR